MQTHSAPHHHPPTINVVSIVQADVLVGLDHCFVYELRSYVFVFLVEINRRVAGRSVSKFCCAANLSVNSVDIESRSRNIVLLEAFR